MRVSSSCKEGRVGRDEEALFGSTECQTFPPHLTWLCWHFGGVNKNGCEVFGQKENLKICRGVG